MTSNFTPVTPKPAVPAAGPADERLTANFMLSEYYVSDRFPELVRPAPREIVPNIRRHAKLLQRVRDEVGYPLVITSGWRSRKLNSKLGGSATSQHRVGDAADFKAYRLEHVMKTIITLALDGELPGLGQVIYYPTRKFIHFATKSKRFPVFTPCVHWPEVGKQYEILTSVSVAAFENAIAPPTARLAVSAAPTEEDPAHD